MQNAPLEFTANAQIWPRSLNSEIGGDSSSTYLIFVDSGSPSGKGSDFVNSFTFLCVENLPCHVVTNDNLVCFSYRSSQRFYSVFDTTNSRVGFATTSQTYATSN